MKNLSNNTYGFVLVLLALTACGGNDKSQKQTADANQVNKDEAKKFEDEVKQLKEKNKQLEFHAKFNDIVSRIEKAKASGDVNKVIEVLKWIMQNIKEADYPGLTLKVLNDQAAYIDETPEIQDFLKKHGIIAMAY